MKLFLQAISASVVIHFLYFAGVMFVGYIKTKNYQPDVTGAWDQVDPLQTQVAFGYNGSPFLFLFTFLAVAMISGMIIFSFKKVAE
ncbi:hypothetical protein J7E38_09630 [Bacillus sp. ISL-35]|uniref:hypothetical protein n=1 Tax=Bacillus sp. ISL-35 TaxID=2819122 RepID=UPI001BEA031B|nr:hypothetical protein [Bacillus sp. ISL-35]MBT2679263.1 hypothetical protein [Bacillus sp. ISL-35]MBT2703159.1 hypothetical protein [Chryseobacterium sp. ISL-80]